MSDLTDMTPFADRLSPGRLRSLLLVAVVVLAACQPTVGAPKAPAPTKPAAQHKISRFNPDGTIVRWNPCRPILIEANFSGAPSFARAELDAAIAALRSASGLDIRFAGTTSARASSPHAAVDPRQASGWAPVRLTFATATEFPFASPAAMGYGHPKIALDVATGRWQYVSGVVVLRPHGWTQGTTSPNPLSIMLRHELGHIVGLDHVSSTQEIMTSAGNGYARTWGPGDLEGLKRVGKPAGCLPTI